MSNGKITVVAVEALSYSGTTWLNLVLGSHPRAFTLGPPWRVWGLKDQGFKGANMVWEDDDTFWTSFDRAWDRRENFLIALARFSGKTHIVFDNPSPAFRAEVMDHPDIVVRNLRYIRDGRAISASFARKNPHLDYLDTILPTGWLYHSFMGFGKSAIDGEAFHYEQSLADPLAFLAQAGRFIGLDYDASALRFWESDHHITWGNPGTIGLLRIARGRAPGGFTGVTFYQEQFEKLQADPLHGFRDERWRDDMKAEDRLHFDMILGEQNEVLGYERETFDPSDLARLLPDIATREAANGYPGLPPGQVESYLRRHRNLRATHPSN